MHPHDCTGAWFGRYAYSAGGAEPVPFFATITEAAGALSGETSEPNHLGDSSPYLNAAIAGERTGTAVRFTKTYDGASDAFHSVAYEGRLDGAGETIEGRWRIGTTSGPFTMSRRHVAGEEEAVEREALVDSRA